MTPHDPTTSSERKEPKVSSLELRESLPTIANLDAMPEQLIRLPRKLEIPPSYQQKFIDLKERINARVNTLGPLSKISDSLLCLFLEVNEGVIPLGFLGRQRIGFTQRMDRLFGENTWSTQHYLRGRLVPSQQALRHYEDAYIQYFKSNPDKLTWLTKNYSDVIDNSPTNTGSRFDYSIQEVPERGQHLHDIAIRRAVHACGQSFHGATPLIVRGKFNKKGGGEGFFLSPGEIPFHRPELILQQPFTSRKVWWQDGSIEHFYQSTRRLIVNEFTADTPFPTDLIHSQSRDSYTHRVAARMTLRALLLMDEPRANLTSLSHLPWMMDYNSFPLGDNGLPREFSDQELVQILRSSFEQLQGLLQQTGDDTNLLKAEGWTSFTDAREFIDAIEKEPVEGLSLDDEERFPDITDIREWAKTLPLFQSHMRDSGTRPIFLARDGLAIMEYLTYSMLIEGHNRSEANEALQRTIYLPGAPGEKTSKNQRASHPLFDSTTFEVSRIALECRQELQLVAPPEDPVVRNQLHQLFEAKTHQLLREWSAVSGSEELERRLYELWFDAYDSIRGNCDHSLHNITIVDTDGSGKTALFIRSVLTFFAQLRGDEASIDILLGALQPNHLGVKNLAELHSLGNPLPDVRWPFKFATFDGEPLFNVRQTPKNVLALLYRSLNYYNIAVRASLDETHLR